MTTLLLALAGPLLAAPALAEGGTVGDHSVRAAEGETVTFAALEGAQGITAGTTRLHLDGAPPGSTLTADGRRLVVPQQGTWQVSGDGGSVEFSPMSSRTGREPSPVRYSAEDADGDATPVGVLTVVIPLLPDMVRSATYGEAVEFPVRDVQQYVDAATLRLESPDDDDGGVDVQVSTDGTSAVVAGQGTWTLDRTSMVVSFAPESGDVRVADPMLLLGADEDGRSTAPAILRVGYPVLPPQVSADEPGASVQFPVLDASRNVRADSLSFDLASSPEGSTISGDSRMLTVPGQGIWSVDIDAGSVSFAPESGRTTSPTPATLTCGGLYDVGTTTSTTLTVQYTDTPPVPRGDQLRTSPGHAVSADVLANDTPGRASDPFDASSVRLRSPDAVTPDSSGRRLTLPGQGVYTVGSDGVLTFTPERGFVGRATPVEYLVRDRAGVVVSAPVAVDVDVDAGTPVDAESGGINSLLRGLEPGWSGTFAVFCSIVVLLLFAGAVCLWIGARMEDDRRSL